NFQRNAEHYPNGAAAFFAAKMKNCHELSPQSNLAKAPPASWPCARNSCSLILLDPTDCDNGPRDLPRQERTYRRLNKMPLVPIRLEGGLGLNLPPPPLFLRKDVIPGTWQARTAQGCDSKGIVGGESLRHTPVSPRTG